MNLKQLKEIFSRLNPDDILEYGVGEPSSWRGSYDEVAFPIIACQTAGVSVENIEKAYADTFYGYKGGEFKFDDCTPVNFESSGSTWTDGGYRDDWLSRVGEPEYEDRDLKLAIVLAKSSIFS